MGLLTTRELAEQLSVSTRTVQRWVDRGWVAPELTLPSGHYRFDLENVKAQLRNQRQRDE
ncbi:helix-turn-helix domain-containing protein [Saccharopolyspora sp. NPDC047091]|uniref:helix-turn-helix domain-containing protein n=1 Tax=Saccharopolyspora sp. NPDC047091 TaxID=3155924 RepID=UPI0033F21D3F